MEFDYQSVKSLRLENSAWKLLCADQAPLIISFLNVAFIKRGITYASETDLVERLRDLIFTIEDQYGDKFEQDPLDYLLKWSSDQCGFLSRAYLKADSNECYYDITPATQKALDFLNSLETYEFVGTESRLLQIFDLVKQLNVGTNQDPDKYLQDLKDQKAKLEEKIKLAEEGIFDILEPVQVKDRFQQFEQQARTLLSDFRQVEYNFKELNRDIRQKIELWDESKGKLIDESLGQSDFIDNTDQGKSALAFSRLLTQYKQNEMLSNMIDHLYELPEVKEMGFDPNLRFIYREWLKADERIHDIIGTINKRIRHFVDDKIYLENRTILRSIKSIQEQAVCLEKIGKELNDRFFEIELPIFDIQIPMDRSLFELKEKMILDSDIEEGEIGKDGLDKLYAQRSVDRELLFSNLLSTLNGKKEITLKEVIDLHPLEYGLEEILNYFEVLRLHFKVETSDDEFEEFTWESENALGEKVIRKALIEKTVIKYREE